MDIKPVADREKVVTYFNAYANMVYRLALARTKSKSDADDVLGEVFLRLMKNQHKITGDEHCKAWLIRATVNCSNSFLSSAWRGNTLPLDETLSFNDKHESDVYFATIALPTKYRTVIHLFYYEELSVSEISKTLGIKETTIKTQLHRGRELLKTALEEEFDDV